MKILKMKLLFGVSIGEVKKNIGKVIRFLYLVSVNSQKYNG
jgi:hypothetical protein